MATAWDNYQEYSRVYLFAFTAIPGLGGLKPGEVKKLRSKLYFVKNDPAKLLQRYLQVFPLTK